MKRYVGGVAAVALAVGLGACGSDGDGSDDPTTPSSATTSTDTGRDEVAAKVEAGEPPQNVAWAHEVAPAGWKELNGKSMSQWRLPNSSCIVTIDVMDGLGAEDSPTADELADEQVQRLVRTAKAKKATEPKDGTVMVPGEAVDLAGGVEQTFETRTFEAEDGFKATVWTRRYGDFAAVAHARCGEQQFDEAFDSSIRPFFDLLIISLAD